MIGTNGLDQYDGVELFLSGDGYVVTDKVGNEYIDFILGYGPVVLGHRNAQFGSRMAEIIMTSPILLPGYSEPHYQLAEVFKRQIGEKLGGVCFFKTGSESITAAIRMSTMLSGRKSVVRCGFTGWHDASIYKSPRWHRELSDPVRGQSRFEDPSLFRGVSGDEEVFNWSTFDIEELELLLQRHERSIAAFVIDAYQLSYTSIENIRNAIALLKKHGVLVTLDETKTAGRVSLTGAFDLKDLDWDFVVMGKAIANGFPLSILGSVHDLNKLAPKARVTGTFSKEVISIHAALETQKILEGHDGRQQLTSTTKELCSIFNDYFSSHNLHLRAEQIFNSSIFDIRGHGLEDSDLEKEFIRKGILLLIGHPSYVCFDFIDGGLKQLMHSLELRS